MPLIQINTISNSSSWALWEINESIDELIDQLQPAKNELEALSNISNEKRKSEWLAGRLVIKKLAEHYGYTNAKVLKDEFGKPYLDNSKAEVSISHSFPYAAAIIDQSVSVGIDIEHLKPKLVNLAERFLSEQELAAVQNNLHKLCLYWSAKEVLYKVYHRRKLIYKKDLEILPFNLELEGFLTGNIYQTNSTTQIRMKYTRLGELMIVYSI